MEKKIQKTIQSITAFFLRIKTACVQQFQNVDKITVLDYSGHGYTKIPDHVFKCKNLTKLDLWDNQIKEIPPEITQLKNLTELDLWSNQIKEIPPEITQLKNLAKLDLRVNQINEIPKEIAQLKNLTELYLSENQINEIPKEIRLLKNLTNLRLDRNQINEIPPEITQLKNLTILGLEKNQINEIPPEITQLKNLEKLGLGGNQIKEIPLEITQLKKLTELHFKENQIKKIPPEIIQLKNLNQLGLGGNQIKKIPPEIAQLKNLIQLYLWNNQINEIPKEIAQLKNLTELYLQKNHIKEIPPEIGQLVKLKELDLDDNPISFPPKEIVDAGVESIANFYEEIEAAGKEKLYEAKLLIIGEGGAGKTSFCKKIIDLNYELVEEEVSTEGIEVSHYEFPLPEGKKFRLNLWDFGGQAIYHHTHQFFLTERSLYTLITDQRKEDTDFNYWLNIVELLSNNSPLLIIQNEKQDRQRDIDEGAIRKRFKNVKEICRTNLKTNRGLEHILRTIGIQAQNLPHIGDELPKSWVAIRVELESKKEEYLSLEAYLEICARFGIDTEERAFWLSKYLHDLGVILHFQDIPALKNLVILNNEWATDAAYTILDNRSVKASFGRFSTKELSTIWSDDRHKGKHNELLELMKEFKLCYKVPDSTNYIVPQRLASNSPDYQLPKGARFQLKYQYDFMPKGIVTRFMVEMHHYIQDHHNHVWKTGVYLHKDHSVAEIIETFGKNEIVIQVVGPNRQKLWLECMGQIDKINKTFHNLKVDKLIPCNCQRCKDHPQPHFFEEEKLREFYNNKKYKFPCNEKPYYEADIIALVSDLPIHELERGLKEERHMGIGMDTGMDRSDINIHVENKVHQENTVKDQSAKKPKGPTRKLQITAIIVAILLALLSWWLKHKGFI